MGLRAAGFCLLTLGVLASGPWLLSGVQSTAAGVPLSGAPPIPAGCQREEPDAGWTPTLTGADQLVEAGYDCNGTHFRLTLGQYLTPVQGEEAVSDLNVLTPKIIKYSRTEIDLGDDFRVNEHHRPGVSPMLVWTWYGVGRHTFASPVMVKAVQMIEAVGLVRHDATVAVLSTSGAAPDAARALVGRMAPQIRQWVLDQQAH
ncbi:MAG: exosortase-associated EpsI family protein [Pseudomonadales bacterium]